MILKEKFEEICLNFTDDKKLIENLITEIENKYSGKNRHYHNLEHLENMFEEIEHIKGWLDNYTNIAFSVFYHDIVYEATSKSNEEKSAVLAGKRLRSLGVNDEDIQKIYQQILATKFHKKTDDNDTDFLLDADLSILGKDHQTYLKYTRQIRKEYSVYPDFIYKPGRKKVLEHFLQLESIFKTAYFRDQYEMTARSNIESELINL